MSGHSVNLPGVMLIEPKLFLDSRGYFLETWNDERYPALGLSARMVQDNLSSSKQGVLRGLHYQFPHPQGKLVSVLLGKIFDVAVDIRVGSPTYGEWNGVTLSGEDHRQFYIPPGFAHGYCVLTPRAIVAYKCTELYRPKCESTIAWNDSAIGIQWPVSDPILSAKDADALCLADIPRERLPRYEKTPTA
ncbi:MAG: dTDP-4-dehydrorhamnose 3,5-epimerase [Planctomycetes bacterium]|nr:dTDP-4-dehydrorhamnose 3,5-epimerase [Planctomycetota bacterium]